MGVRRRAADIDLGIFASNSFTARVMLELQMREADTTEKGLRDEQGGSARSGVKVEALGNASTLAAELELRRQV